LIRPRLGDRRNWWHNESRRMGKVRGTTPRIPKDATGSNIEALEIIVIKRTRQGERLWEGEAPRRRCERRKQKAFRGRKAPKAKAIFS